MTRFGRGRDRDDARDRDDEARPPAIAPGRVPATLGNPVQRRAVAPPAAPPRSEPAFEPGRAAPAADADADPFAIHLMPTEPAAPIAVQRKEIAADAVSDARVAQRAAAGVAGPGGALPFLDRIQDSFGADHDLSSVRAHVGGDAAAAAAGIGASAYATGRDLAFGAAPDLHLAAHEAAHVVQQRAGFTGVGAAGDAHEQAADAVADRVVRGESAADLLHGGGAGTGGAVQRRAAAGGHVVPDDVQVTWGADPFTISFDVPTAAPDGIPGAKGSTTLVVKVKYKGKSEALGGISFDAATKTATMVCRLDDRKLAAPSATVADDIMWVNLYKGGGEAFKLTHEVSDQSDPKPHRQHFLNAFVAGAFQDQAIARIVNSDAVTFDDDPLAAGGFGPGDARIMVRPQAARATLIRSDPYADIFAKAKAGDWDAVRGALAGMPMRDVLDLLESARQNGTLDFFAVKVGDPGVMAATLAVQHHLGVRFRKLAKTLPQADQDAIRAHVMARIDGGDVGDAQPLIKGYTGPADNAAWIDDFLGPRQGHLQIPFTEGRGPDDVERDEDGKVTSRTPSGVPRLAGQRMTRDQVIDTVVEQGALCGHLLDENMVANKVDTILWQAPQTWMRSKPSSDAVPTQLVVQYSVMVMQHTPTSGGPTTTDNPNHQFSLQYTVQFHADSKPGFEASFVVQVAAFKDSDGNLTIDPSGIRPQSVTNGFQLAYVAPFIGKFSTIQAVVQAATGVAFDQKAQQGGAITYKADQMAQYAGQVQAVFDLPVKLGSMKLQFVALGQVSTTATEGNPTTLDRGFGFGLQLQF